jgi:peptide/nickel transport system permease protein
MVIAMGIGAAPGYARLIRGQVLSVRRRPYVEAAAILGHPYARVVVRTILPNALRPLVGVATIGVADMIVVATSLGFLGLGAQPPSPEWGAMLAAGRDYFSTAWWVELFPGAVIITLALATATVGRHLLLTLEGRTAS